jgi:hypothetical protein
MACLLLFSFNITLNAQQGVLIKTNQEQNKLLSTYRFVFEQSENDYRTNEVSDKDLFSSYGEMSIYRITSGDNSGQIVYPNSLPDEYANLSNEAYSNFDFTTQSQVSVQFKKHTKRIAIFKSSYKSADAYLNWESVYFERLFSEYIMSNIYYTIDEETLASEGLDENTELFIIPAFLVKDADYTYYIDSLFTVAPSFKAKIDSYLQSGGSIYSEGNASYFLEKLGYLEDNAIDYSGDLLNEGMVDISVASSTDILSLGADAAQNKLYGALFPTVNSTRITTIAADNSNNNAVVFKLNAANTLGGKIHCNTGLPTVKGLSNTNSDNQQISWTLNSILAAFSSEIDVTRKVTNEIVNNNQLGDNTISYDRLDTFNVSIQLRNLSSEAISVDLEEEISPYFTFLDVVSGPGNSISDNTLIFSGINMAAYSELTITYRLITPEPDNTIHENVDNYIAQGTLINSAVNITSYTKNGFNHSFQKNKGYADILFSARIFADTDVNYKNFLGLEYQPFKVFMIMENKSRSAAEATEYVQYIPKDVPFYWSDQSLNIPILKTPGGKYVDVLRGSNDELNPEFDMDSDGDPDVWLDTASIYPKGYTLTEESVYWANPWNHLRTGDDSFVFEDLDHDGIVPTDTDGDGIVDSNFDEDDKMRVWVVTWDIGHVAGYEYYDPYCSYEIWVDPPNLIPLSAGVADAYDSLDVENYPGMFYPYGAGISDTSWTHWMERDDDGNVIWDQLIHQRINNYEGFTFVDTSTYEMLPTDSLIGTAPQPHREFLAVLSLGGEEIDMQNYTPTQSLYSKVNYETAFGEERVTPIRTTYTYWAPLPNPLQFEYLSNNYQIIDTTGNTVTELPEYGKAHLVFDMDASTEYTYYWIRNVGYDVDYNDASEAIDGIAELGDGVFGYFVYSIPKGMGGYKITLPTNADGSYNTDSIVKIDGQVFSQWIDNPNTLNEVEVWETAFEYQIYIPQLLIPAALDDDNFDGIDDWIDDEGDRFESETGYLHDAFMPGNGEAFEGFPAVPFEDDIYGTVNSGWYNGADGTYGDDYFETLGKTHITINADYEGRGREGNVEISKGGVLVCEEIFGGSPWVIFSHVLSGYAEGTDISLKSEVIPNIVYYGIDTVYLKHTIADTNEPHSFNASFDPYHISYGYGESTITTYVGAKDPCSLIEPAISMPALIDPTTESQTITLVPLAAENPDNTDLSSYPRDVTGAFIEVRVEVGNSTDDNWINTTVTPQISSEIGSLEMSYVAYPRPLVPSHQEGGEIVSGDQPGTFTTGWRFNQPEGEVLIKMGNTLNLLQPTRRAYFVFLIKVNSTLENGIYEIPFTMSGESIYYTGINNGTVSYDVPTAKFSVVEKDANGNISEFQKLVLENSSLADLAVSTTSNFVPTGEIKYSNFDIGVEDFASTQGVLEGSGSTIDLSKFSNFPNIDTNKLVILQKGVVDSYTTDAEILALTGSQTVNYTNSAGSNSVSSDGLTVKPIGPRIKITNAVYSINGVSVKDSIVFESEEDLYVLTLLEARNTGTDISSNTIIRINSGPYYTVLVDSLEDNCTFADGILSIDLGDIIPGELKQQYLPFLLDVDAIPEGVDMRTVIDLSLIEYEGTLVDREFSFEDPDDVLLDVYDFEAIDISFNNLDDGTIEVNAEAHNRGISGSNVWFRIYSIVGGGAYEFAFAEIRQEDFMPGETIKLSGIYTVPNTDKSIEFIAIIDDALNYSEVTELNNSLKIGLDVSGVDDNTLINQELKVFPVPFTDIVTYKYSLTEDFEEISISLFNMQGQMVSQITNCPTNNGLNQVVWRNSDLANGNYIYKVTGKQLNGQAELLFNGQITKVLE